MADNDNFDDDDIVELLEVISLGPNISAQSSATPNQAPAEQIAEQEVTGQENQPFPNPTFEEHEVDPHEELSMPSMDDLNNILELLEQGGKDDLPQADATPLEKSISQNPASVASGIDIPEEPYFNDDSVSEIVQQKPKISFGEAEKAAMIAVAEAKVAELDADVKSIDSEPEVVATSKNIDIPEVADTDAQIIGVDVKGTHTDTDIGTKSIESVENEPEILVAPKAADALEATNTPTIADAPEVTDTPTIADAPESTETPKVADIPEVANTPKVDSMVAKATSKLASVDLDTSPEGAVVSKENDLFAALDQVAKKAKANTLETPEFVSETMPAEESVYEPLAPPVLDKMPEREILTQESTYAYASDDSHLEKLDAMLDSVLTDSGVINPVAVGEEANKINASNATSAGFSPEEKIFSLQQVIDIQQKQINDLQNDLHSMESNLEKMVAQAAARVIREELVPLLEGL